MPDDEPILGGRRRAVARGSVINSVFLVALGSLSVLKAVIAASLLTQTEFGIWSVLFLGILMLLGLKAAAVSDKYIQQSEDDQELAFQKSFTLELISAAILLIAAMALAPLLAFLYGDRELIVPMIVLATCIIGLAFQAPIWVFHRRLDFLRQRIFLSVDPVVGFVLTVLLAVLGFGYWSLVIGTVAGAFVGGAVAVAATPYKLAWRYDSETTRNYVSFSWPLVVAVGSAMVMAQISLLVGNLAIGIAAAGAIGLAATFSAYADRVDSVIMQAMYPAICRAVDSRSTLREAFEKSNRLALMWAFPFGVGVALFAADLVRHVLGPEWGDALILLQAFGLTAAFNHIAFNFGAFYRALGETKPIAIVTVTALVIFLTVSVPLTLTAGLEGLAAGTAVMCLISLALRRRYVLRLFPDFPIGRYVVRAILPTAVAAAVVLLIRAFAGDSLHSGVEAMAELAIYGAIAASITAGLERTLLREMGSYLRGPVPPAIQSRPV